MERLLHLCVCVSQTLVLVGVEFYIALPSVCVCACFLSKGSECCSKGDDEGTRVNTTNLLTAVITYDHHTVINTKQYSSGRSNTWSVEAMKTIAKYEKDCKPQRYCILYHTSNAYCARSAHDGYVYSHLPERH